MLIDPTIPEVMQLMTNEIRILNNNLAWFNIMLPVLLALYCVFTALAKRQ